MAMLFPQCCCNDREEHQMVFTPSIDEVAAVGPSMPCAGRPPPINMLSSVKPVKGSSVSAGGERELEDHLRSRVRRSKDIGIDSVRKNDPSPTRFGGSLGSSRSNYTGGAVASAGAGAGGKGPGGKALGKRHASRSPGLGTGTGPRPSEVGSFEHPVVRQRSEDEVKSEKQRLQELVKAFAKRAVVGESCEYVDGDKGIRSGARYSLDCDLEKLVVDFAKTKLVIPLSEIEDVHIFVDSPEHFSQAVVDALSRDTMTRLCVIVYKPTALSPSGRQSRRNIHLLLRAGSARDDFRTCLKILRLYSGIQCDPSGAALDSERVAGTGSIPCHRGPTSDAGDDYNELDEDGDVCAASVVVNLETNGVGGRGDDASVVAASVVDTGAVVPLGGTTTSVTRAAGTELVASTDDSTHAVSSIDNAGFLTERMAVDSSDAGVTLDRNTEAAGTIVDGTDAAAVSVDDRDALEIGDGLLSSHEGAIGNTLGGTDSVASPDGIAPIAPSAQCIGAVADNGDEGAGAIVNTLGGIDSVASPDGIAPRAPSAQCIGAVADNGDEGAIVNSLGGIDSVASPDGIAPRAPSAQCIGAVADNGDEGAGVVTVSFTAKPL